MTFNDGTSSGHARVALDLGIKEGDIISMPMADACKIYKGDIVKVNAAGYASNLVAAAGDSFLGVAVETVDNTSAVTGHAAGFKSVRVWAKRGQIHKFYKATPVVDDVGLKAFSGVGTSSDSQTVVSAATTTGTSAIGIGLIVGFDATAGTVDVAIEPGFDISS